MSVAENRQQGTLIGALGTAWRATVSSRGRIEPENGSEPLDWWVAAEDRWHDPQLEATVRQRRVGGTPVVETRLRVPGGDVVQRVYAVADDGGITIIEIENDSAASVAVVFSHGRLLTSRPPADVPIEGIEVPAGAVSFPVGHHSTMRVGISHRGAVGPLPSTPAVATSVVRGWTRHVEAASRLVLPDEALVERLVEARAAVALAGFDESDADQDAAGALLAWGELVRMGADADDFVPAAVTAAEKIARGARTCGLDWDGSEALAAAGRILMAAGDARAAGDVAAIRARLGAGAPVPEAMPAGVRAVPWIEGRFARTNDSGVCVVLPDGHPDGWLGANWEVHGLPAGAGSRLGYAVRWHGERPALLWEVAGAPVTLRGGSAAPEWSTDDSSGETLWPQPSA